MTINYGGNEEDVEENDEVPSKYQKISDNATDSNGGVGGIDGVKKFKICYCGSKNCKKYLYTED